LSDIVDIVWMDDCDDRVPTRRGVVREHHHRLPVRRYLHGAPYEALAR